MYNLPDRTLSGKSETDENPSISEGFSGRYDIPDDIRGVRLKMAEVPEVLLDRETHPEVTDSVVAVYRTLSKTVGITTNHYAKVWKSDKTIAADAVKWGFAKKLSGRTVSAAWPILERLGVVERRRAIDNGAQREIWCLWRLHNPDRIEFAAPHGAKIVTHRRTMKKSIEAAGPYLDRLSADPCTPLPFSPPVSADFREPDPSPLAQISAENVLVASSEAIVNVNGNGNGRFAGGEGEIARPELVIEAGPVVAQVEPETPPALPSVEDLQADLARAEDFPHRGMRAHMIRVAVTNLRRIGRADLVPAAHAQVEDLPGPAPDTSRPSSGHKPSSSGHKPAHLRTQAKPARLEDGQVGELVEQLGAETTEARREAIATVAARKIAEALGDLNSEGGFLTRLRSVGFLPGSLWKPADFVKAYTSALASRRNGSAKRPGAILNDKLNKLLVGRAA